MFIKLAQLNRFWTNVKTYITTILNGYVAKEDGKGLSTNDLTTALKTNYDAAYTHSQADHAPATAQENVIEGVTVNGSAVDLTNKIANITVPTTVSSLTDAGNYALKSDLTTVYKYKGSKATYAELPANAEIGDVWDVVGDNGKNYAWNGTDWDDLGGTFTIETATDADIDALFA